MVSHKTTRRAVFFSYFFFFFFPYMELFTNVRVILVQGHANLLRIVPVQRMYCRSEPKSAIFNEVCSETVWFKTVFSSMED